LGECPQIWSNGECSTNLLKWGLFHKFAQMVTQMGSNGSVSQIFSNGGTNGRKYLCVFVYRNS
jgi:hypothetical protein